MLSGARGSARKAFALLIVLSLVFSLPVFAVKLDEMSGVISMPTECFGVQQDPSVNGNVDIDYWFFQDTPATFEVTNNTNWSFSWAPTTAIRRCYSIYTYPNKKIEFIINVSDGEEPYVDFDLGTFSCDFIFQTYNPFASHYFPFTGYYEIGVDGVVVKTSDIVNSMFVNGVYTGPVKRYVSITYYTTSLASKLIDSSFDTNQQYMRLQATRFSVNDQPTQLDRIEINIGNIESDVDDIKISVENIEEGVVNIEGAVTDMKEQLEDSSSPIWSAAGEKIVESVTGLFVPPEEELTAKKQELEQKLDDKLGTAGDLVDVGEEFISGVMGGFGRDDIGNSYTFQFPGITFPMNGEEYVIIPAQEVKLNNRAFVIFQDALGFAITAICFFSIIHICEDAIYCLISGVSYWGFVRSRHDK